MMFGKLLIAAAALSLLADPALARDRGNRRDSESYGYDHRYYEDRGVYRGRGERDDGCRGNWNGGAARGRGERGDRGDRDERSDRGERGDRGDGSVFGALFGSRADAGERRCR